MLCLKEYEKDYKFSSGNVNLTVDLTARLFGILSRAHDSVSLSLSESNDSKSLAALTYRTSKRLYSFKKIRPLSVSEYLLFLTWIKLDSNAISRYFSSKLKLRFAEYIILVLLVPELAANRIAATKSSLPRFFPKSYTSSFN